MDSPLKTIAERKLVEEIAHNMRVEKDYFDDLVQEVYMILATGYTEEKLQEAITNKQINYIITKIMKNQYFSSTSPFYRIFKKYKLNSTPLDNYDAPDEE